MIGDGPQAHIVVTLAYTCHELLNHLLTPSSKSQNLHVTNELKLLEWLHDKLQASRFNSSWSFMVSWPAFNVIKLEI